MKILMVNKFLYPAGGAETYIFKLGEHLEKLGHKVEYFGMNSENRCVSNSADCYTDNIDFRNSNAVGKLKYSVKSIYSNEARKKIKIILESFRPDIVHLNNINFQLTPSIIYEIKKHNIPIVQTLHDTQIACPCHRFYIEHKNQLCTQCEGGKYYKCTVNKCLQNSAIKSILASIESYLYHSKGTYNLVDKYICPSRFIADVALGAGINREKTIVLHNFSDNQPALSRNTKGKKYALYFGRLSVEKGIQTLIEACRELPDIHFVFAGTGPLAPLCEGINNIDAVGFKSGSELLALIENAEFSICPSECYENCSMSVVESLSLGTPVIASDLGGTKELVDNEKNGLIFEAGNRDSLKSAIKKLYNNSELTEKMRAECINNSSYTVEKYTERLLEIYSKLKNGNG